MSQADLQCRFWDSWVGQSYEWEDGPDNRRRAAHVLREVARLPGRNHRILDVGCGSGWLARQLAEYGSVTATDLSAKTIEDLRSRYEGIDWISGDFLTLDFPMGHYDVVTCLETIAHVPDQEAFARRIAEVIRPGGLLLLTTQNGYIWSRTCSLQPRGEGQIRNWPSRKRLRDLFTREFEIRPLRSCAPGGDRGLPWIVNNRISNAVGRNVFGGEVWTALRESIGVGKSLVLRGERKNSHAS